MTRYDLKLFDESRLPCYTLVPTRRCLRVPIARTHVQFTVGKYLSLSPVKNVKGLLSELKLLRVCQRNCTKSLKK